MGQKGAQMSAKEAFEVVHGAKQPPVAVTKSHSHTGLIGWRHATSSIRKARTGRYGCRTTLLIIRVSQALCYLYQPNCLRIGLHLLCLRRLCTGQSLNGLYRPSTYGLRTSHIPVRSSSSITYAQTLRYEMPSSQCAAGSTLRKPSPQSERTILLLHRIRMHPPFLAETSAVHAVMSP